MRRRRGAGRHDADEPAVALDEDVTDVALIISSATSATSASASHQTRLRWAISAAVVSLAPRCAARARTTSRRIRHPERRRPARRRARRRRPRPGRGGHLPQVGGGSTRSTVSADNAATGKEPAIVLLMTPTVGAGTRRARALGPYEAGRWAVDRVRPWVCPGASSRGSRARTCRPARSPSIGRPSAGRARWSLRRGDEKRCAVRVRNQQRLRRRDRCRVPTIRVGFAASRAGWQRPWRPESKVDVGPRRDRVARRLQEPGTPANPLGPLGPVGHGDR